MTPENYKNLVQSGNYEALFNKKFTSGQLSHVCTHLATEYGINILPTDFENKRPYERPTPTPELISRLKNQLYKAELITLETLNKEQKYYVGGFEVFDF